MAVREEQGNLKQTVYITSDRKRFRDRSEADVHEKYLGWAQKVQQLGIKEITGHITARQKNSLTQCFSC